MHVEVHGVRYGIRIGKEVVPEGPRMLSLIMRTAWHGEWVERANANGIPSRSLDDLIDVLQKTKETVEQMDRKPGIYMAQHKDACIPQPVRLRTDRKVEVFGTAVLFNEADFEHWKKIELETGNE